MKKMTMLLMVLCVVLFLADFSFAKGNGECKRDQKKDGSCKQSCISACDVSSCVCLESFAACDGSGKGKGNGKGKESGNGECKRDGSGTGNGDCKRDGSCTK